MRTAWRALRPNGTLLLSLPVGPDLTVFNLHRRYGALRLPRMLRGWEELERIGWEAARMYDAKADHRRRYEPMWVLRRNSSDDLSVDLEEALDEAVEIPPASPVHNVDKDGL